MKSSTMIPTTVLFFSSILWGCSWLPLKGLANMGFHGLVIISLAYSTLFICSLPWVLRGLRHYADKALALTAIFFVGGLANLCFNYALIEGEVLRVMALFYLLPVWGVLGGRFILKERTSLWRWTGVVAAVLGTGILLEVQHVWTQAVSWIDVVAIGSGLFFAATILLFRGVEGVPVMIKLNTLFLGTGVLSGLALLGIVGGKELPALSTQLWWIVLFALGWLLWSNLGTQWACTKLPAGRTSIIMVMELVAASVSAVIIGGETLTSSLVIGGLLIFSATVIEVINGYKEQDPPGPNAALAQGSQQA